MILHYKSVTSIQKNKDMKQFDYYYLLSRILENADKKDKILYCKSFQRWFNDRTNSKKVREICLNS